MNAETTDRFLRNRLSFSLDVASGCVFLFAVGVVLPILTRLSNGFMMFHEAEMSLPMTVLVSIPLAAWMAAAAVGAIVIYVMCRTGRFGNRSTAMSTASFSAILVALVLAIATLVTPMFAILSAINT